VRGASFAQVLDRLVDCGECARISPNVTTAPISGAPYVHRRGYVPLPFVNSLPAFAKVTVGKPGSRPRRVLNGRMRAALDVLRSAGAVDLSDDFLLPELKAAFRRLARTAHPDMHPRVSEHEQRCLVARFREIREAYLVLTAI
jgi:hypothetical protein